ncbi:hypothetical protein CONLIGDRAFT_601903 [Coniochaeta ligniaria NRRL 30616]|uniref:Uncharacterized protein n=1 Tax=Coniochaeta ligniaria NRRL 30616 TaxID=1408157 RepID=A0A1J7JHE7_9PEZI|nr:hypothetical protein CONLIGDRAFT_601903 [Coniochaeta ligniaria NRRL 30616]
MSSSSPVSTPTRSTAESSVHDEKDEEDLVAPSPASIYRTFAASKQHWQYLSTKAASMCLQRDTVRLSGLTIGLPAIPDNLQGVDYLTGQATWELKSKGDSNLHKARTEGRRLWSPSRRRPTLCTITNDSRFTYSNSKSNGVALLFFGWAYILCTSLLERQRIPLRYTNNVPEAPSNQNCSDEHRFTVDLGIVSDCEFRWWSALLSPGQGWRSDRPEQPVWAIVYTGNIKFQVVGQVRVSASPRTDPPSSTQAAAFLSRFASMYNLESQAPLALAMAMTIPLHNETRSVVELPKPSLFRQDTHLTSPSSIEREYSNLSHYMTLSSNPIFLSSALWGIFWEPGVDCNLVGPWCDPIIDVVEPLVDKGDLETLAHVFALRRPTIAPLWYGIAACGQTKTITAIVPFLKTLHAPTPARPIPEVAAWTGAPQSFMDLCGSGPYEQGGSQVAREDVWRLRHECWDLEPEGTPFRNPPMSPWPPFGHMGVEELEISLRTHLGCERHRWVYARWTWLLGNGTEVVESSPNQQGLFETEGEPEPALSPVFLPTPGYSPRSMASEKAVGDIFRWASTEIEASGKSIYTHPWVDVLADFNMGLDQESDVGSDGNQTSVQRVEQWVEDLEMDGFSS